MASNGLLRLSFASIGLLSLTACQSPRIADAVAAQQTMIGMPKVALLQCAGAPSRSASSEGIEVLTYDATRLASKPGPDYGGGGWRHWWAGERGGATESRNCQASFIMESGRVTRVMYGSADSDGERRLDQCYAIVENCLPAHDE